MDFTIFYCFRFLTIKISILFSFLFEPLVTFAVTNQYEARKKKKKTKTEYAKPSNNMYMVQWTIVVRVEREKWEREKVINYLIICHQWRNRFSLNKTKLQTPKEKKIHFFSDPVRSFFVILFYFILLDGGNMNEYIFVRFALRFFFLWDKKTGQDTHGVRMAEKKLYG